MNEYEEALRQAVEGLSPLPPKEPRASWLQPGDILDVTDVAADVARGMVRQLASDLKRPAGRVGFAASMASAFALRRSGMPPLLAVLLGVAIGFSAEKFYEMAEDIHETSLEQRAYLHEQLRRQAEADLRAAPKV